MQEVICINDKYSNDVHLLWKQFGVTHPKEGEIYTIRELQKHSNGKYGVRLVEIKNPQVPVNMDGLKLQIEPSFDYKRFSTLNGKELTLEEIKELEKEKSNV